MRNMTLPELMAVNANIGADYEAAITASGLDRADLPERHTDVLVDWNGELEAVVDKVFVVKSNATEKMFCIDTRGNIWSSYDHYHSAK